MGFFYSFTETLIHSLWQAGLLALLYAGANSIIKRGHPLQKRDLLYGLLTAQVLLSLLTFFIYFTGSSFVSATSLISLNNGFSGGFAEPLFYGYIAAVVFKSTQTAYKWKQFRGEYKKQLVRPSAELKIFTELKAYHLGIKRKVTLWYSRNINVPLTFGFFKPVILLPFSLANRVSMAETEAIILHELAHIKSRDYLLNWVLIVTETIYFFNPFIKILAKNIRLEREKNCDIQVLNFNYPQLLYAEALLKIARNRTAMSSLIHLGAVKRTPELISRIRYFSEDNNLLFRPNRAGFAAAFLLPLLMAAGIFFIPVGKQSIVRQPAIYPVAANSGELFKTLATEPVYGETATPSYASLEKRNTVSRPAPATIAEDITDEHMNPANMEFAIPAGYNVLADSAKEFIYDIETPQGKVTQSFRLESVNGRWVLTPQWMTMETRPDSCFRMLPVVNMADSIQ